MPRTPELHDYHCSLIKESLSDFNSTSYGVNYESILNELPLFHVADWQLPQDIMHIILEGVLPLELKLLLRYLSVQNFVSVHHLNIRIESFQYGYSSKASKPSALDPAHIQEGKIRQSGMCLLLFLISLHCFCSISKLESWKIPSSTYRRPCSS